MNDSLSWIEKLSELRDAGRPCTVVVVTDVSGSGPRESGARMIVSGGELVWGTIGGGKLEHMAIEHGSEMTQQIGHSSESIDYPLSEKAGQCCGGRVTLFYEPFTWTRTQVVIFGAGHVGQALAGLAPYLGVDVLLIDGRLESEIRPPLPAERPYKLLCIDAPEGEVAELPEESLILIMTHSHALDLEILAAALERGGFAYVGLIGSDRKWERFQKRLASRGFSEAQLDSVRCPIGVSKNSKVPAAIAVSTAAELLEVIAAQQGKQA